MFEKVRLSIGGRQVLENYPFYPEVAFLKSLTQFSDLEKVIEVTAK